MTEPRQAQRWLRLGIAMFLADIKAPFGKGSMQKLRFFPGFAVIFCVLAGLPARAAENPVGPVTKQPLPRFVSLRASQTNLREGPGVDYRIAWVFKRAGQPVEVIGEFDIWRRVRDSDGSEGWVMSRVVSARRTAVIAPWSRDGSLPLYGGDSASATLVARLQPNVLANLEQCTGKWCKISGDGFAGWIQQEKLWGAYPGESVKQ